MLQRWGFTLWGKKNEELVYVRDFGKKINENNLKHTYPFISRSSKTYIVPIYEEYHTELLPDSILNTESPEDFVEDFPHRNAINKVLKPIFDELFNQGLKPEDSKRRVVIHTLRHTFASQLAIAETPIYTIMRLMDHSDISQTIRYAKLSSANGRDAVFNLKLI